MSAPESEAITPTAHYTGYVWARNGLSHSELATRRGRIFYQALGPAMTLSGLFGGPTLEPYLLARHRAIDALLERAIEQDGVSQVIELACGLSPRGWRFRQRYGEKLTYIEGDLPDMARQKRLALERMGSLGPGHRVEAVDALRENGPESVGALVSSLDPQAGLVIITEGLVGYLPSDLLEGMWSLFAKQLASFRVGYYLCDLQLGSQSNAHVHAFRVLLGAFVRGQVAMHHYSDCAEAELALQRAGFAQAAVRRAIDVGCSDERPSRGARMAHVAQAMTA